MCVLTAAGGMLLMELRGGMRASREHQVVDVDEQQSRVAADPQVAGVVLILPPGWRVDHVSPAVVVHVPRNGCLKPHHERPLSPGGYGPVRLSYTHLRAHETVLDLVCRL